MLKINLNYYTLLITIIYPLFLFSDDSNNSNLKTLHTFASLKKNDKPSFIKYNILASDKKHTPLIYDEDKADILFTFSQNADLLPSSFGSKDLLVLYHPKQKVYSYYSFIELNPKLQFSNFRVAKNTLLGFTSYIESTKQNGIIYYETAYQKRSLHHFKTLNPSYHQYQLDNSDIKIESIGFQSGIFEKYIFHDRSVRLPLRRYFNIYIYYKLKKKLNTRVLPYMIEATIQDSKHQCVMKKKLTFDFIYKDKLNSKILASTLYKKHGIKNYLFLGKWTQKKRTEKYTLNIRIVNYNLQVTNKNLAINFH